MSRERARRRRRRGEGGRALPRGRDWRAACAPGGGGGGGGGGGPEPDPGASPAETQSVCVAAGAQRLRDPPEGSSASRVACQGQKRTARAQALPSNLVRAPLSRRPHRALVFPCKEPLHPSQTSSGRGGGEGDLEKRGPVSRLIPVSPSRFRFSDVWKHSGGRARQKRGKEG